MNYDKLIRDHIPAIIAETGRRCTTEVFSDAQYRVALRVKLVEEAQEVQAASLQQLPTELADVLEVIDALMKINGIEPAEVQRIQLARHQERGGFSKRLRLLVVE